MTLPEAERLIESNTVGVIAPYYTARFIVKQLPAGHWRVWDRTTKRRWHAVERHLAVNLAAHSLAKESIEKEIQSCPQPQRPTPPADQAPPSTTT